jgi:hypothetical protein
MPVFPHIIFAGSDKGGVGKTTIARALADYYTAKGLQWRGFDTESPLGNLKRFYPDQTEIVDFTRSDGQMTALDTLRSAAVTIIDLRAGLLSPTLKMLGEIGFLNAVAEGKLRITLLHVLGSVHASFAEIASTVQLARAAKLILVKNHANDASYLGLSDDMKKSGAGMIEIPKLNDLAAEHVDAAGVGFDHFCRNESNSLVLSGYVRSWLAGVFKQFDSAKLNEV